MKAKDLAEQLLKYPDFDVEFDVCIKYPTHDNPYPEFQLFKIVGIDGVAEDSKVIVLDVIEI